MVLSDTAGSTCVRISSLDAVQVATAARTMCLYYAAVQNLVYWCGSVPHTTAESSNALPNHCAQHVQQSVDMSILEGFAFFSGSVHLGPSSFNIYNIFRKLYKKVIK